MKVPLPQVPASVVEAPCPTGGCQDVSELVEVAEQLPDALFVVDVQSRRYLRVNAAAERMLGMPRELVVGRTRRELLPPHMAAHFDAGDDQLIEAGAESTEEVEVDTPAGRRIIRLKRRLLAARDGQPRHMLGLCEDVTEVREAERSAQEASAELFKAKSRFLANISHELRTPLNGVVGMVDVLLATPLTDEQRGYADVIRAAAGDLRMLIDEVLDFAKLEAGHVKLEEVPFAPMRVIASAVDLYVAAAANKGLVLRHEIAGDVATLVRGDPHRVRQIVTNLINNAVKFTNQGSVVVSVRPGAGPDRLHIDVTDTGIGMTARERDAIFQPFVQAQTSTTRIYGGTGLGLAICSELVEAMGGTIGVESTLGQGSRFWVELPLAVVSRAARAATVPPAPVAAPAHRGRLLVAEDNRTNQLVARAMLAQLGWEVEIVPDGRAAVEAHARGHHDAILMDRNMPTLGGLDATRAIRTGAIRPDIPIIAMTALATDGDRADCLAAGMDDVVTKPITRELLVAALDRVVARAAATAAPAPAPAPPAAPAVDAEVLDRLDAQTADATGSLVPELIAAFLEEVPAACAELTAAVAAGDLAAVTVSAHRLRSSTGNLGAVAMSELCRQLEVAARASDLAAVQAGAAALVAALPAVEAGLAAYRIPSER